MILEKDEYCITHRIPCNTITITKQALEEWRDHYFEVATNIERFPIDQWQQKFYLGKADVLTEILKHFEED